MFHPSRWSVTVAGHHAERALNALNSRLDSTALHWKDLFDGVVCKQKWPCLPESVFRAIELLHLNSWPKKCWFVALIMFPPPPPRFAFVGTPLEARKPQKPPFGPSPTSGLGRGNSAVVPEDLRSYGVGESHLRCKPGYRIGAAVEVCSEVHQRVRVEGSTSCEIC